MGDRIPEGRRAPIVELLCPRRTVKTQTFNRDVDYDQGSDPATGDADATSDDSCPSSDISRSQTPQSPISPAGTNKKVAAKIPMHSHKIHTQICTQIYTHLHIRILAFI